MVSETGSGFASRSLARLLERLAFQVGATAHSPSAANVHDLRVAIRRFEQALVAFRQALPGREVKRIRRKLKSLMSRAGDVRDCDVLQKLLLKCEGAGVAEWKERVAGERKANLPALAASLRRWSLRRTSSKWRAALLPADPDAADRRHLAKLARKFLTRGDNAASAKVSAEDLHAFRIDAKKFRYTLELFEPLHGAAAREWLAKLKPVQSALGDIQDCRTAREAVERLDGPAAVQEWLKKRQRRKTREFREVWLESFGSAAARRRLIAAVRHTPRKPVARSTASGLKAHIAS